MSNDMNLGTTSMDHGLTAEEEAALKFNDADEGAQIVDPDAEPQAAAQPAVDEPAAAADPAADPVAAAGAVDEQPTAATDSEPEPASAAAAEPAPQPQAAPAPGPILNIQAPEDAAAKLAQIATDKAALIEKWESGEITGKEYQTQLETLNEQQFDLKSQVREADLAQKLEAQRIQNLWIADCNAFLNAHAEYKDPAAQGQLDHAIKFIASLPENQGLSNHQALDKAHRMVQAMNGQTPAAQAQPAPAQKVVQHNVPKPPAPPNIGNLPAAAMNDTSGGEFAALNALQKSGDVEAYEAAVANMTDAQRARYFRD